VDTLNPADALILGIVEGLTEFLPVSSTGHLILTSSALNLDGGLVDSFNVAIQSGAIMAVVILYWKRFKDLFNLKNTGGLKGPRGLFLIALTTAPALALAALFHKQIKAALFSPGPVALALACGGLAMILIERRSGDTPLESLDAITPRLALGIGLFQCLSLWPGMSRAAATIIGARLLGLRRGQAAEYSFLAAVPILVAATAYELVSNPGLLGDAGWLFGLGFFTAFATAWFAIKAFLYLLGRWTLAPFGWYRLALAGAVFWIMAG
jgi:undecaprenyl-diphosphatase